MARKLKDLLNSIKIATTWNGTLLSVSSSNELENTPKDKIWELLMRGNNIIITDLNTLVTPGIFNLSGTELNIPPGMNGSGVIEVIARGSFIYQRVMYGNTMTIRSKNTSSEMWQNWS